MYRVLTSHPLGGGKHLWKIMLKRKTTLKVFIHPLRGVLALNASFNHHLMVVSPPDFSKYYVKTPPEFSSMLMYILN